MYRVGTAAWSIPKEFSGVFSGKGQHLERYARCLKVTEINSSFYREHKPATYSKWARMVPEDFRFSVKLSKVFTHERRLEDTEGLAEVLKGVLELGPKLGALLIQLPPSLKFDHRIAARFFRGLRRVYSGNIAFEPRHASWVTDPALKLLQDQKVSKVVADPERCEPELCEMEEGFTRIAETAGFAYYRLHGSPVIYRSKYGTRALKNWAKRMRAETAQDVWCILDNTALGYATGDALELQKMLSERGVGDERSAA
jgi:uncharacterized protein YecE (DUF72 family)